MSSLIRSEVEIEYLDNMGVVIEIMAEIMQREQYCTGNYNYSVYVPDATKGLKVLLYSDSDYSILQFYSTKPEL